MSRPFPAILLTISGAALSACSGGGSGGAAPAAASVTVTAPAAPKLAAVEALRDASLRGNSPLLASGSTPNFSGGLPATGTVIPFSDTVVLFTSNDGQKGLTVTSENVSPGTTLTFQGTQSVNGVTRNVFDLSLTGVVDAKGLTGSTITTADGTHITLGLTTLNYTLTGWWNATPAKFTADSYWAWGTGGFQTPLSGLPTSGTATYSGGDASSRNVLGMMFVPSGSGITGVTLTGQASIGVNFATGGVNGSLTNMTAGIGGDDAPPLPWNDVALSGTMTGAALHGTTSVANAPGNALSMGSGASGGFTGALYGPNAQELGATWTLYDPAGSGKTAVGVIGATTP